MAKPQTEPTWYASKIDWWLALVICIPPLAAASVLVSALVAGNTSSLIVGAVTAGFVLCLYVGLLFPLRYGITASELVIQHGLIRRRISTIDIASVTPTRNPLSSPALSLDRIDIRYGEGFLGHVLISPADREAFLEELLQATSLRREGDKLLRVKSDEL